MFEIVFAIFVLFFFCLGLGEFLHLLRVLFFASKQRGKNIMVSFLREQNAVKQTRKIIEKYRWYGTSYADEIFVVFDNLKEETGEKVLNIIGKEQNVFYCNRQSLIHILSTFDEEYNEQSGTTV